MTKAGNQLRNNNVENYGWHTFWMPICSALLWTLVLFLGCYTEWYQGVVATTKTMIAFLIVYAAFFIEVVFVWLDVTDVHKDKVIHLESFRFFGYIFGDIAVTLIISVLFFVTNIDWYMYVVILTAGGLKYLVGAIGPWIERLTVPYKANTLSVREV